MENFRVQFSWLAQTMNLGFKDGLGSCYVAYYHQRACVSPLFEVTECVSRCGSFHSFSAYPKVYCGEHSRPICPSTLTIEHNYIKTKQAISLSTSTFN